MSSDLTPARLAVLVAAADAGPWFIEREGSEAWIHAANGFHVACVYDRASDGSGEPQFDEACEAHAELLALSPALAARVIELEAEVERLNDQLVAQAMVGTPAATIETGDPCTLAECPIGLFYHGDELCMKTEYGNNEGRIDAFIVSSGEFFWGHAPQTIASQRASIVTPAYAARTALEPRHD